MDDVTEAWMRTQRVATPYARQQFLLAAKAGRVSVADLISFCEIASSRLDGLEQRPRPEPAERSPCQCPSCLGYNGWFASCQGYRP